MTDARAIELLREIVALRRRLQTAELTQVDNCTLGTFKAMLEAMFEMEHRIDNAAKELGE